MVGGPYVYDAENHLTSADGVTYTYDGDGNRVMKLALSPPNGSNGMIYWYGANDAALEESGLTGNLEYIYYYFGGQRVARQPWTNEVNFYFTDHLGNVRYLGGSATGYGLEYYPFGGTRLDFDTGDDRYQFTGKERDPESGLDNFGARYDSSSMGRFMSPDEPLLDQEASDPQSWNLYSYVRNNPLNNTDPTGNACVSNGNGGWVDDNSGGQSCKDAQEPQKVEVKAKPGSAISAFFLNLFISFSNQANNYFRPVTNAMGIQPSYMQDTPTGSGATAAIGAGTGVAATFFIGPEAEGINITVEGLEHVAERHMVGGALAAAGKKSIFNAGEDVQGLIKAAEGTSPVRQATGNFERVVDAGRPIGIDRTTGAPTSTYTVITKPNGNLVTAFPGKR